MTDPTCVVIKGLPREEAFDDIVGYLANTHGPILDQGFRIKDKGKKIAGLVTFGWIRFGHPDKARAAMKYDFGDAKYPKLKVETSVPLWKDKIPPPGAFRGEIATDSATPSNAAPRHNGILSQHAVAHVSSPSVTAAMQYHPPRPSINMLAGSPKSHNGQLQPPVVRQQVQAPPHQAMHTRPDHWRKPQRPTYMTERLVHQSRVEYSFANAGLTSGISRRVEHDSRFPSKQEPPYNQPPLGGIRAPPVLARRPAMDDLTTSQSSTPSASTSAPIKALFIPAKPKSKRSRPHERSGRDPDKCTFTNDLRNKECALDDKEKFIINWFQHGPALE